MSPQSRAIITDGLWRKSLSATRSLGKAGYAVTTLGDSWFTTSFWSRFTRERVVAPTAAKDPEGFGKALIEVLSKHPRGRRPVLLPMEDASLMWLSAHREKVSGLADFLIPSEEALGIAQDKGRTLEIAEAAGLPCPKTWRPANAEAFADRALSLDEGGFVAKPASGTGSAGIVYGEKRSREEWISHWNDFGPMLLQERVPATGKGRGVSVLMDRNGECIAAFAHERLEQYPNTGGPSTDRRSIHAPELVDWSIRLLKRLDWRGVAMVEWKLDPSQDDAPRLMEINPRFWGSLELAVRAGVDFPLLYAQASQGEQVAPVMDYPAQVRCRWMVPGEVLRWLTQDRSRRESLHQFLRGLPGLAEEWDWRDIPGTIATMVCTGALALNPRYWRYVRRR